MIFGIPKAFGSYEELLVDPDIEAIYIPLPNHLHVQWSIRAGPSREACLCEKPIAMNTEECRQLIQVRNRTKLKIGEAFMVRSHPRFVAPCRPKLGPDAARPKTSGPQERGEGKDHEREGHAPDSIVIRI